MKKLFVFALLLFTLPNFVSAQETSVLISPLRTNFTAQPGSTVRAQITLENPTNKFTTVTVVPKDFEASKELDGKPVLLDAGTSPYGISNWLADANLNKQLTIPANQKINYEAVFRVPFGIAPKTYFGSVTFRQESGNSVGSLVFITVGNPETKLTMESLEFGESDDATKPHGVFKAIIKNTSDGLSTPTFKLKITDRSGKTVLELVQDNEGSVLPNSSRKYTFTPAAELPNEMLTVTVTATDQNGTTADKSIQLDRELTKTSVNQEEEIDPKAYSRLFIIGLLALIILIAITAVILHKRAHTKNTPA